MIEFNSVAELKEVIGQDLGVSDVVKIDREKILMFSRLSGDDHWIHTDDIRAAKELPGGKIIAHGYLILSLITALANQIWSLRSISHGLNYGLDKVRFLVPVPVDAFVRLRQTLLEVEALGDGYKIRLRSVLEIDGVEKPACVAETIAIIYENTH